MTPTRTAAAIAALLIAVAACGDDDEPAAETTPPAEQPAEEPEPEPAAEPSEEPAPEPAVEPSGNTISLTSSALGDIVTDADGNALYLFTIEAQGEPSCYEECEANWPILSPADAAGAGLDGSLLGTVTRTNGDEQATYNGWPLYYFAGDVAPGDTNGQGVNDVWFVIDAQGNAISA